jgi:hypothetical protein
MLSRKPSGLSISPAAKDITLHLPDSRTGNLDHHFSATFQQLAGFTLEVLLQEEERALGILVDENAHELDDVFILQGKVNDFFHQKLPLAAPPTSLGLAQRNCVLLTAVCRTRRQNAFYLQGDRLRNLQCNRMGAGIHFDEVAHKLPGWRHKRPDRDEGPFLPHVAGVFRNLFFLPVGIDNPHRRHAHRINLLVLAAPAWVSQ